MKLLSGWNAGVSHGVPVGPAAFRLLAEVAIGDIDQALKSEGIRFCRFSDDYRLFAKSERAAREAFAFLANALFRNHGLTLQESKSELIESEHFVERFERTERDQERSALEATFAQMLADAGVDDDYGSIDVEDLDEESQALLNSMNLWDMLSQQIRDDRKLDVPLTRFLLRRVAQLGLVDTHDLLLSNLRRLFPLFREVVEALGAQDALTRSQKRKMGNKLLKLFDHPLVGHLEYHRAWILSLFAQGKEWNQYEKLVQCASRYSDTFTRRDLILALGRAKQAHWFKSLKQEYQQLPTWERRAFLAAASCLPGDEAVHWYRSIQSQLDHLERAVVAWARQHPF